MQNVVYNILSTLITMGTLLLTFYLHDLHDTPKDLFQSYQLPLLLIEITGIWGYQAKKLSAAIKKHGD